MTDLYERRKISIGDDGKSNKPPYPSDGWMASCAVVDRGEYELSQTNFEYLAMRSALLVATDSIIFAVVKEI